MVDSTSKDNQVAVINGNVAAATKILDIMLKILVPIVSLALIWVVSTIVEHSAKLREQARDHNVVPTIEAKYIEVSNRLAVCEANRWDSVAATEHSKMDDAEHRALRDRVNEMQHKLPHQFPPKDYRELIEAYLRELERRITALETASK